MEMKRLLLILTVLLSGPVCLQAQLIRNGRTVQAVPFDKSRANTNRAADQKGVTATLKYEKVADMKTARIGHQIFPSAGGGVVVVGGHTTNFALTTSAELYENGQWRDLSISSPHDGAFSLILKDGRVMVGGGFSSNSGVGQSKSIDIYDPSTRSFSKGPDLSVARANCNAVLMGKGAYVAGNWYAEDETFDYYNGSTFQSVGYTLARTSPYLFTNNAGYLYILAPTDNYGKEVEKVTTSSGELKFPTLLYDESDGNTYYLFYSLYNDYMPLSLPGEFRTTDYFSKDLKYYFVLAKNGNEYILTAPAPEESSLYWFPTFEIPTKHPVTNAAINWRGGVFVNDAKSEIYLIGWSGTAKNQTVHIISFNYSTAAWTIASSNAFGYDLMGGSWTLLPDGRLMCAGGSEGDNFTAQKKVCIFTIPEAGTHGTEETSPSMGGSRLVVWLKSGEKVGYELSDQPVTTFSGSKLIIQTNKVTIPYERKDVLRYTYEYIEATGIDLLPGERRVVINREGDEIIFRGLQAGSIASVYAVNGRLVEQRKASDDLPLTISLKNRPNGVYIVKAGTEIIKVMKR